METQTEKGMPNNGQLIFVAHSDTIRLLEVYVKRSLSLNDGALGHKTTQKGTKWVTMPKRRMRRHSSDPSIHLAHLSGDKEIGGFAAVETPADKPEPNTDELEKTKKKSKKNKKPSLWRSFLGLFSQKGSEDKDGDQDSSSDTPKAPPILESPDATPSCLPRASDPLQRRKSTGKKSKRRRSKRRLSLLKLNKTGSVKDINPADITGVESVVSVEPTYSYYERVSEEMKKIVHEVKEKEEVLTNEEIINRIITLTKEEGDAIDDKLKDNPTLSSFFQRMSYPAFQKLVDTYVESETSPTKNFTVLPTAPELVKLAFTLDFTARIAALSRQNIGHITGLGNRYLQDRFEYKQACTDHPWSDDDAND
ncbi:hypothetical protein LDENG_00128030 [Lucifuga dentata]|nr:hypothetical protein LDENG_00128030 [Lucifuga dentata]